MPHVFTEHAKHAVTDIRQACCCRIMACRNKICNYKILQIVSFSSFLGIWRYSYRQFGNSVCPDQSFDKLNCDEINLRHSCIRRLKQWLVWCVLRFFIESELSESVPFLFRLLASVYTKLSKYRSIYLVCMYNQYHFIHNVGSVYM